MECVSPFWGFPGSSAGQESACNSGDLGSIPRSGRSPGEGIGYPLQYSWASLVTQTVKNLPAMRETWVQSLGWEDPLEEGTPTTPVFLPGESHGLQPARLLGPWNSPGQNTEVDSIPFCRRSPNPGIEPRSLTLRTKSWPTESLGNPKNTGVGSLSLLQGIFWTQESNWCLLHCRQILYQLSYQGSTSSVQLLSRVWLFATPWTAAHQASLSITNFWSLLKLMSVELVMPSNHLILCHPLLLPPSILPSVRVFFQWVSS